MGTSPLPAEGEATLDTLEHVFARLPAVGAPTGWQDPEWRRWRVESIRRSLAMLHADQIAGLTRDDAKALIAQLQALQRRLDHVRTELRRLADEL